jgi:hypothetical protein
VEARITPVVVKQFPTCGNVSRPKDVHRTADGRTVLAHVIAVIGQLFARSDLPAVRKARQPITPMIVPSTKDTTVSTACTMK